MPVEESVWALTFATLLMVAGFGRGMVWLIGYLHRRDSRSPSPEPFSAPAGPQTQGSFRWVDLFLYITVCVLTLLTAAPLLPIISVLLGWWIIKKNGVSVLSLWGFRSREWGWYFWRGADYYLLAIAPLSIFAALSVAIYNVLGIEVAPQPLIQDFLAMEDTAQIIQLIVLAVVIAPLWEELVFRGILYPILRGLRDPVFGMLSTAVLFGLVHGHGPSFFPLAFLGFILAYVFEKTGKLGLCIGLHAVFNASTTITLLLIKYA